MPVLDASVLVEYLAGGEHAEQARARVLSRDEAMWAPHLVDAEVGHVLRRAVLAGELRPATARAALVDLADFPLRRAGHVGLLQLAWALHSNLTFYDALYVALAEQLDMPLITLDSRLATASGVRAVIDVIA
ncbi:MAG TPA: type II toxin-antitoxin system VapC family toxin [Solirubrobacteraceae bacterium]|jgi:predicted nucleic acid-binding protein|nr:type II toxin-antitoxin system VapC family toxin [Solirubrobacteraceae bacterium]